MSARKVRTVEEGAALDPDTPIRFPNGDVTTAAIFRVTWYEADECDFPATVLAPAIDPDDEALVEKVSDALYAATNGGLYDPMRLARAALKAVTQ